MKKAKSVEDGIDDITKGLVDDDLNHSKTKYFKENEKKEIIDYLLENKRYTSAARKHFEKLV